MKIGDRRELTKDPITTTQLVMYAGASGDFNRIHYDQRFAQEAGRSDVIAHGLLTMAFAGQLASEWAGEAGMVRDIGGRFLTPVQVGDIVTVEATVVEIEADGQVKLKLGAHTARGQVFAGDARILPGDE